MLRAAGTIIGLGAAAAKGNSSCKQTFAVEMNQIFQRLSLNLNRNFRLLHYHKLIYISADFADDDLRFDDLDLGGDKDDDRDVFAQIMFRLVYN